MKINIFISTIILIFFSLNSIAQDNTNSDDFANNWIKVEIGMSIDEANKIIGSRFASMGLSRTNNSGYRKYWKAPISIGSDISEDFVLRGAIPYGDVYVLYFDKNKKITRKKQIYVTEEKFQAQVQAHRKANAKE